ncbi:MAG: pseudouridine synthase [gamma proteobacterium symbiont of Bathyaustriella thionipta]|nr:pseudouridine synthase [gamma proteobacterium symbiont of Bathyaustriella thionipta]
MATLILFNKPYGVLSQFSGEAENTTLAAYIPNKKVYPAGRLDKDSEGLLLLTDDGGLQHRLSHPDHKTWKRYRVQVEGHSSAAALKKLRKGVMLKDGLTRPAKVKNIAAPKPLWARNPPVRFRKNIPDCWLEIEICEGRNRQVRRMTAAVGLPTLRLIRMSVGQYQLNQLQPGEFKILTV